MQAAYRLSPGRKALLTLFGAEHMLGGISGYAVTETTDENPARVALIQRITLAYLRSVLLDDATAWSSACQALATEVAPLGQVEGTAGGGDDRFQPKQPFGAVG